MHLSVSCHLNILKSFIFLQEILTPGKSKSRAEELPMKERVLQQCGQDRPLPFTAIIPPRCIMTRSFLMLATDSPKTKTKR